MYRMMIIDDEPIVRSGLKQLLPWAELGFDICAEGTDGKDGLNKVMEYQPDLVLVDVKMPGMTGIELIRESKKQGFEGKFIILTGYSDFEFAKTAVSLGVRAYLLKPIDEDELRDNINEVLSELDAARNLEAYYGANEIKAKQEILRRVLLYIEDKQVLRGEIKSLGIDFKYHSYCVCVLTNKSNTIIQDQRAGERTDERVNSFIRGLEHVEKVPIADDRWAIIYKGGEYSDFEPKLRYANDKLKALHEEGFFVTIGHNVSNWEDLHFSYECANVLLEYGFLYEDTDIVTIKLLECSEQPEEELSVEKLCHMIDLGDNEGITALVAQLPEMYRKHLRREQEIKIRAVHTMTKLHNVVGNRYEQRRAELPDIDALTENIKNAGNVKVLIKLVGDYCRRLSEIIGASSSDNVIKRMYAYMENNYDRDLKLETIAKMFNYNSAYLGKIFKKEIGESYNNVLDNIRIDNAKRLLSDTNLKVYQVSEKVGFSNIDYFYAKFKRYVGISPKEYKKDIVK